MVVLLYCAALLIPLLFPNTPAGAWQRRLLIEIPARKLMQLKPVHIACGLLLLMVSVAMIALFKGEGVLVIAQGVPEGLIWFATFDIATYLDVMAVAWLVASTVRLRAIFQLARMAAAGISKMARRGFEVAAARVAPRDRSRRGPRRPPRKGADDGWPAVAFG
jgi:hypothetical protein